MLETKSIWFEELYLVNFLMFYLLVLVQVLLVIFEAGVWKSWYFKLLMIKDPTIGDLGYGSYVIWNTCKSFFLFSFSKYSTFKTLRTFYFLLKSIIAFLRVSAFVFWLILLLLQIFKKYQLSSFSLIVVQMHHLMINHYYNFLFEKILLF